MFSRYLTEKKLKHESWFLYYPEEGNTRGAPTQLLRFGFKHFRIEHDDGFESVFRGVEFGLETKALLYKRLCAYAGLHCEVIKGYR